MAKSMTTRSDAELRQDVLNELHWDPAVTVSDPAVTVAHGNVTVSGTSQTYASKAAAEVATARVLGVTSVTNAIVVDPAPLRPRLDSDIADDVRTALALDCAVPATRLGVAVRTGIVTLSGAVDWYYQRADAQADAEAIAGVRGLVNQIAVLQPAAMAAEIADGITQALARNADLHDDAVLVSVSDRGQVTLAGTVATWSERNLAEDVAWRAAGVTEVTDTIEVQQP
jgi:osmotically-inducible protein OsmY